MNDPNGNHRQLSVDVIETEVRDESTSFYDPMNPVFAPPKQKITTNKKAWKRKLIGWSFVFFLIAGGVFALYLLVRVKHVNVRVQSDPRRESANAKTEGSPGNAENGLSAEAINIARQAIGADVAIATGPSQTSASATASPLKAPEISPALSFSDNSPVYSHARDISSTDVPLRQSGNTETQQQPHELPVPQARANSTQTLFVADSPATLPISAPPTSPNQIGQDKKALSDVNATPTAPAVLPVFGTILPVRTQGVIFSLRNDSLARLELVRDCEGEGWSLRQGTLLIGRIKGSEQDRAFINIEGYIDPGTNRFVKMTGEVLGADGASGIQGKRMVADTNRLKQILSKVASSGLQVAGMMAGALTGRGTVVLNGAGYRIFNPITDEAGQMVNAGDGKRSFVKVGAGQQAYVMVADLPKELHAVDARGEDDFARAASSLTDREVMELIFFGTPNDIRAALPLMNEDQKRLVVKSIGPEK